MGVRYHSERQCTIVRMSFPPIVLATEADRNGRFMNPESRERFTRLLASMMPPVRRYVGTAYGRTRCARLRTGDGDFDISGLLGAPTAQAPCCIQRAPRAPANAWTGVSTKKGRGS